MRNVMIILVTLGLGCAGTGRKISEAPVRGLGDAAQTQLIKSMSEAQDRAQATTELASDQIRNLRNEVGDLRKVAESAIDNRNPLTTFAPARLDPAAPRQEPPAKIENSKYNNILSLVEKITQVAIRVEQVSHVVNQSSQAIGTIASQVEEVRVRPLPPAPTTLETGGPGAILALVAYILGWITNRRKAS